MAKKKYYVVWEGRNKGVFENWSECHASVKDYPGARYKGYSSLKEAEQAYYNTHSITLSSNMKANPPSNYQHQKDIDTNSICVDAACSGNPGLLEYRGVDTRSGNQLFIQGPFEQGTNNIGEFLALVHGLAYLKNTNSTIPIIYSDSKTAMAWVRNKAVKTTLKKTSRNQRLFELVDRAIIWLKANTYNTRILKWETKKWGEIPADFGRK